MSGIKDLARRYAKQYNMTVADAEVEIKKVLGVVTDSIIEDGGVSFIGNFTIETVQRAERVGRNPLTREEYTIPACRSLKIKCGKLLKQKLNS